MRDREKRGFMWLDLSEWIPTSSGLRISVDMTDPLMGSVLVMFKVAGTFISITIHSSKVQKKKVKYENNQVLDVG